MTVRGREGGLLPGTGVNEAVLVWREREGLYIKITAPGLPAGQLLKIAEGLEVR